MTFRCCFHFDTSSHRRRRTDRVTIMPAVATLEARVTNSRSMANSVVVVYFSRLGGRLRGHQKLMLDADARLIAKLMGCEFGGRHEATCNYSNLVFFVPVLLFEEAKSLGICSHRDLYVREVLASFFMIVGDS